MKQTKTDPIVKIWKQECGMGVEIIGATAAEFALAWAAMTNTLITLVERHGSFEGGRREALHNMIDDICDKYEETKTECSETKRETKETKAETQKPKIESFKDFKENFFKTIPEARKSFENDDPVIQTLSDFMLHAAYAAYKADSEGQK